MDAATFGVITTGWLAVSFLVSLALGGFLRSGLAAQGHEASHIDSDRMNPGKMVRALRDQESGPRPARKIHTLRSGSKTLSTTSTSARRRPNPVNLLIAETAPKKTTVRH